MHHNLVKNTNKYFVNDRNKDKGYNNLDFKQNIIINRISNKLRLNNVL